jgi:Zn finger protein HypA/HybF involved in hydrogenase expression
MGIANSILDAVRTEAKRFPGSRIRKVGLRIGEYAGVDTESLSFCFDALKQDTDLAEVALEIEYQPASADLQLSHLELEE